MEPSSSTPRSCRPDAVVLHDHRPRDGRCRSASRSTCCRRARGGPAPPGSSCRAGQRPDAVDVRRRLLDLDLIDVVEAAALPTAPVSLITRSRDREPVAAGWLTDDLQCGIGAVPELRLTGWDRSGCGSGPRCSPTASRPRSPSADRNVPIRRPSSSLAELLDGRQNERSRCAHREIDPADRAEPVDGQRQHRAPGRPLRPGQRVADQRAIRSASAADRLLRRRDARHGGQAFIALRPGTRGRLLHVVPLVDEPVTSFQMTAIVTEQGVAVVRPPARAGRQLIEHAATRACATSSARRR